MTLALSRAVGAAMATRRPGLVLGTEIGGSQNEAMWVAAFVWRGGSMTEGPLLTRLEQCNALGELPGFYRENVRQIR
jgi:hypothetical protein